MTYGASSGSIVWTNASVAGTDLIKGDTWLVGVLCFNDTVTGSWVNSSAITINNTAPDLTAPTILSSNGSLYMHDSNLTCSNGTFSDWDPGDTLNYSGYSPFRWFRNGTVLAGYYNQTLVLSWLPAVTVGENFTCEQTAYDVGYSPKNVTKNSSQVTIVTLYAPVIHNVTLCEGLACNPITNITTANTLGCSANVSDEDNATIAITRFEVYRNGTQWNSWDTYGGSNSSLIYMNTTVPNLGKSDTWQCRAMAWDGQLNSTYNYSWNLATVNNTAPTITAPSINDSSPTPTSVVNCTNGTFTDADLGDTINATGWKRWFVAGIVVAGATGDSLDLSTTGAVVGQNVSCEWQAQDINYDRKNASNGPLNSSPVIIVANVSSAYLQIHTYDELNYTRIYFNVVISNSTNSNTTLYTYEFNEDLTKIPTGAVTIDISNTSYFQRTYYLTLTNVSTNLSAYLLPATASSISVNFYVETLNGAMIEGAFAKIEKAINGTYTQIGQMQTDASGIAHFWLDQTTSYRITTTHPSYNTYVTTITPTSTQYIIYLSSSNETGHYESAWYDVQWSFSPLGLLNANYTQNLTFSSYSKNNSIVWTAWKIYNHSTLLNESNLTGANGTTLNYSFKPGPNASIMVYFYIMHTNQSNQALANWGLPIPTYWPPTLLTYAAKTLEEALPAAGGVFSTVTIALGTILIGVMVAGWVAQFSMTGGTIAFLSILGLGMFIGGAGAFITGVTMFLAITITGAYYLWRSGG